MTFAIPTNTATDKRVRFLGNETSDSDAITTGFFFYGSTAFAIEGGQMESPWHVLKISELVYALYWNDTSLGQVPVSLKNNPPSNAQSVLPPS